MPNTRSSQPHQPPASASTQQQTKAAAPASAQMLSHDQLYQVGYQLALDKLGYKGMQSKIFADAFVGEYQRALENGLNNVLAIRFGAEFAGPFAMAFMHYLDVNQQREEDHDIYGGARAFAQMSFDVFEEPFAEVFAPIHEEQMEAKNFRDAVSKALKQDVNSENLEKALQQQYAIIYKKGYQVGFEKGREEGFESGQLEGSMEGQKIGQEKGYKEGFESGRLEGEIEGKKMGRQEGHSEGYYEAHKELTGSAPEV